MLLTVNMTVVDDILPAVELEFWRKEARRVIEMIIRTLHGRMIANGAADANTRSMGVHIVQIPLSTNSCGAVHTSRS